MEGSTTDSAPAPTRSRRWNLLVSAITGWFRRTYKSLALAGLILVVWTIYTEFISTRGDLYFPSPDYVIVQTLAVSNEILLGTRVTFTEIMVGYVFSVVFGIIVGIIVAESLFARQFAMPMIVFSYSMPTAIVAPLFVIWFGTGLVGIGLFIAWTGFFPVLVNTIGGLTQVDEEFHHLAYVTGTTRWQKLSKIKFWAALPHIVTGLKIAIQQSIVAAIIAEFIASGQGLGGRILYSAQLLQTGQLFGVLFVLMTLSMIVYFGLGKLIERLSPGPS